VLHLVLHDDAGLCSLGSASQVFLPTHLITADFHLTPTVDPSKFVQVDINMELEI
jgi:hypothetical protein